MADDPLDATYVLPLRWLGDGPFDDLTAYLQRLASRLEVIVVDGSAGERFAEHHRAWDSFATHLPPDPRFRFLNGKVNGVLTGIECAGNERVVVADDDVRYSWEELERVIAGLEHADVVRPQNYFSPLPWHARWDTARILLNRALGGDFPGTLGVRRSTLLDAGGYDGDVLWENLELMRTVEAAGGLVLHDRGCLVRRLPPTARHFAGQRVRQAYDEWARPARMAVNLAILPVLVGLLARRRLAVVVVATAATVATAEAGRRREGGVSRFPASSSLLAPAWLAERAVCSWLALARRATGGCPYAGTRFVRAATPLRRLRARYASRPGSGLRRPAPQSRAGRSR
ncbi:MAG TPA: glycosyltransferase family 2 protein [Acidimicrobiales bacterium]|nr:glycosyltransferase family 2 protein [Acidimicrobiales bacterium]